MAVRRTRGDSNAPDEGPLLCEVAWEVCQQVGGIYTVIRSKAPSMVGLWGPRYLLVGPYNAEQAVAEFEELPVPDTRFGQAVRAMQAEGLTVYYGRWLVSGEPRVVLMDTRSAAPRLGATKYALWEHHDISLPGSDGLVDDVVAFGHMVERFFHHLLYQPAPAVIAHFHEWMAGSAIPELRRHNVPVSIVFTTHATMLGRYLAMNDPWFYDHVPFVDWLADARRFNIEPQVRLERAAAHGAHLFTTVSQITAFECQFLAGRKPDMLLPNGLNIERFVAMHEFQNLHRTYKEQIHDFVIGHFFPSYTFDLDRTLYFFSSGRYEYRNKGFDITIDALAQLNWRLRDAGLDRTIVFFLPTRRPCRSVIAEVLQSQAVMEEMRRTTEAIQEQIGQRLFMATVMNRPLRLDELVDEYWRLRLRRLRHGWRISRLPSIVTHELVDDAGDDVLNHVRARGLINRPEDAVKIVYHPDFISPSSPLFGMDYPQFVRGCHLGIFPSYYEPWGYTPEECVAMGVPSVTSDLAGFGSYVQQNFPDHDERGMFVVPRRMVPYQTTVDALTDVMFNIARMERRERIDLRNHVESSSPHFDWHNLIEHYGYAYSDVLRRTGRLG